MALGGIGPAGRDADIGTAPSLPTRMTGVGVMLIVGGDMKYFLGDYGFRNKVTGLPVSERTNVVGSYKYCAQVFVKLVTSLFRGGGRRGRHKPTGDMKVWRHRMWGEVGVS